MQADTLKRCLGYANSVLIPTLIAAKAMPEECKPVHAQLGEMVFHDPGCVLDDMSYSCCAERPITGTYFFYSTLFTQETKVWRWGEEEG